MQHSFVAGGGLQAVTSSEQAVYSFARERRSRKNRQPEQEEQHYPTLVPHPLHFVNAGLDHRKISS